MYHSVMSCLRFWGPILATSSGAYGSSWRTSCSSVAHRDVGNSFGGRGVKSHMTCLIKISRNELGTSGCATDGHTTTTGGSATEGEEELHGNAGGR